MYNHSATSELTTSDAVQPCYFIDGGISPEGKCDWLSKVIQLTNSGARMKCKTVSQTSASSHILYNSTNTCWQSPPLLSSISSISIFPKHSTGPFTLNCLKVAIILLLQYKLIWLSDTTHSLSMFSNLYILWPWHLGSVINKYPVSFSLFCKVPSYLALMEIWLSPANATSSHESLLSGAHSGPTYSPSKCGDVRETYIPGGWKGKRELSCCTCNSAIFLPP